MLRIHIEEEGDGGAVLLRLEGKLVQPWVQELVEAWTALVQRLPEGREVRVILDAVSFVDEHGRSALCLMGRKGCAFRATGPFMDAVIEDVNARVADGREARPAAVPRGERHV